MSKHRSALKSMGLAAETHNRGGKEAPGPKKDVVTTTIVLPRAVYERLRTYAGKRVASGGRFSVSAVLVDLTQKYLTALEREDQAR